MIRDRFKFRKSDAYWIADNQGRPLKFGRKTPRFDSAEERDQFLDQVVIHETLKMLNKNTKGITYNANHLTEAAQSALPDEGKIAIEQAKLEIASRYHKRDPLDDNALDRMGLMKGGTYPAIKAIMQINHDVKVANLFNQVANTVTWVSEHDLPGFKQIPASPAYGQLAGKYVPDGLADEIISMRDQDSIYYIYENVLRLWKMGKTVLNPATHARNLMGNVVFAEIARTSPLNPMNRKYYTQAIQLLAGKGDSRTLDKMWQLGVPGGDFARNELQNALLKISPTISHDLPAASLSRIGAKISKIVGAGVEKATRFYAAEDDLYKIAAYLKYVDLGMSPEGAAAEVRRWFPYYDHIPKTNYVKGARVVMPFYSFFHESMRVAANAIHYRPLAFARVLSYPAGISMLSLMALGLGDDDWEEVQKDMRGQMFGKPIFSAILPIRDENGRLIQWDMTYTIPYASLLGKRVEPRDKVTPMHQDMARFIMLSNPLMNTGVSIATNRDTYFGRNIRQTGMGPIEGRLEEAKYIWKQAVPPLMPGGTAFGALTRDDISTTTLSKRNTWQQALRSLGGIDFRYAGPQVWRMVDDYIAENEYTPQMSWGGDTTPSGRARYDLYQAVLHGDQARFNNAVQGLAEIEKPIKRMRDIDRLIRDRHPLRKIKKEDRRHFINSLPPEGKRVVDEVLAEYDRAAARARQMYRKKMSE